MSVQSDAIVIFVIFLTGTWSNATKPNIVFLLVDDLGYNDVGYAEHADLEMQFLDSLAAQSLKLKHSYTPFVCSPSRAAILTGNYPFRYGMQTGALHSGQATGLDLSQVLLPQYLKDNGYQTHIVGKWHIGYCKNEFLPLQRGFDTFRGFLAGAMGYYDHINEKTSQLDYWDNNRLIKDNVYSTDDFAQYTAEMIRNNEHGKPMFLYLSIQAIHGPLDLPPESKLGQNSHNRAKVKDIVKNVDKFAETIVSALKEKNLWENTIFVFTSDNGGQPVTGGNNYPLRGAKHTLWEGGTRVRSFVHHKSLTPGDYHGLFHAVDWLPTLISAAGHQVSRNIDGVDQWDAFEKNSEDLRKHPRKSFFYNIDQHTYLNGTVEQESAVRLRVGAGKNYQDYKLILGNPLTPSHRVPPSLLPKFEDAESVPVDEEIHYPDGALFDMTVDDCLLEEEELQGHHAIKERMKKMIDEGRAEGWVEYVKDEGGIVDPNALNVYDESGQPYVGPGWC